MTIFYTISLGITFSQQQPVIYCYDGPDDLEPSLSSSSLKLGDLKHCTAPLASLVFSLPVCCVLTATITFVCSPLSLSFGPVVVCLPFLSALTPTAGTRWPVLPELCSALGLLL